MKKIGIVTFWSERGAAYVSRQYKDLLSEQHDVFIYARGWEYAEGDPEWDRPEVTWGKNSHLPVNSAIDKNDFTKWIQKNNIDIVFFNEQQWWPPIYWCHQMGLLTGAYIDYYTEATVPLFRNYDFLICNTKRHYQAFDWHPQAHYIPWGTDTKLFTPQHPDPVTPGKITFFQSCGFSPKRKGTDFIIKAFAQLKTDEAQLVIHTQKSLTSTLPDLKQTITQLEATGKLTTIEQTVPIPGLYHLGDVYLAPSRLEGIGLPTAEALACGLPVITVDNPPMNEFVDETSGQLAAIELLFARQDGYYWPQCRPSISSLTECMQYYVDRKDNIKNLKVAARQHAVKRLNWKDRSETLNEIFTNIQPLDKPANSLQDIERYERQKSGIRYKLASRYPFWYKSMERLTKGFF